MKKPALLNNRRGRTALMGAFLAIALLAGAAWQLWPQAAKPAASGAAALMLEQLKESTQPWLENRRDLSTLVADLRDKRIASAALDRDAVYISTKDGARYWLPDQSGRIADLLLQRYADGSGELFPLSLFRTDGEAPWYAGALSYAPFGVLALLLLAMLAVKMRPYAVLRKSTGVGFDGVIGAHEAKQALTDVTAYLRDPSAFVELGARPPRGVLLTGEPGTGKTQLAKALASEANAAFIQVTGSDFSSMYFGVGIQKVKALFQAARRQAPCIIFIDEIDGIGKRSEQTRSSDAESNRIINRFLTEMDGFDASSGVLVVGATNFPNSLDAALLREGRFDRSIAVGLPTLADRGALFRLYAGKLRRAADIDFAQLARNSVGLTPAAIASIVNQAALLAARDRAARVEMEHMVEAIEISRIGAKPDGVTPLSDAERTRIAVHEAGHALVAAALNTGRVEKVTILPRGQALGVTLVTPLEDKRLHLESELRGRIQMLLAGRNAEQLYFHEVSSGAGQDLQEASKLALSMVGALGMGPAGSLLSLQAVREAHIEFDSSETLRSADALLQQLNRECFALLQRMKPALDEISQRLLDEESVPGEAVVEAIARLPVHDLEMALKPLRQRAHGGLERVALSAYDQEQPFELGAAPAEPDEEGPGMA
ncbi:AAA family ATPase [Pseudomonas kuykendallii]|uniref:Cell division protease FtsH n=1 Tax=Pseudomonas kuykendallii TaxID=1007099 RepID=A0A1H3FF26_9PSED|nr:AAA family ATPase [Pseudomonas kuykendallii]MCQ4272366.1 AAA family ATPase [Pseudomonas kuykendallii]SDX89540.1 cell division protease FtsH [Pseudomonas kuykendallii]